jgi:hypothetical protein
VPPPAGSRLAPDIFLAPPRSPRALAGPASWGLLAVAAAAAVLSVAGLATGWWRVLPVLFTGQTTTSFTDTGVTFLTTYNYVVQATRNLWRSLDSTQASFTTPTPACL